MSARREILLIGRFLLTGIANTAVGLAAVALARNMIFESEYLANLFGFMAGLICGFILNRLWTFEDRRKASIAAPRYLIAFATSYLTNLLLLTTGLNVLKLPGNTAQAIALIGYSVVFFVLCRQFVFSTPIHPAEQQTHLRSSRPG